jgi:hypothetical protein
LCLAVGVEREELLIGLPQCHVMGKSSTDLGGAFCRKLTI